VTRRYQPPRKPGRVTVDDDQAAVSDGEHTLFVIDSGRTYISVGGVQLTNPDDLARLADHLHVMARRLRSRMRSTADLCKAADVHSSWNVFAPCYYLATGELTVPGKTTVPACSRCGSATARERDGASFTPWDA